MAATIKSGHAASRRKPPRAFSNAGSARYICRWENGFDHVCASTERGHYAMTFRAGQSPIPLSRSQGRLLDLENAEIQTLLAPFKAACQGEKQQRRDRTKTSHNPGPAKGWCGFKAADAAAALLPSITDKQRSPTIRWLRSRARSFTSTSHQTIPRRTSATRITPNRPTRCRRSSANRIPAATDRCFYDLRHELFGIAAIPRPTAAAHGLTFEGISPGYLPQPAAILGGKLGDGEFPPPHCEHSRYQLNGCALVSVYPAPGITSFG